MKSILSKVGLGKKHAVAASIIAAVLTVAYLLTAFVPLGVGAYLTSIIPLAVLAVTAVARVNDISPEKLEARWHVRRAGLSIVAAAAVALILSPGTYTASWKDVALYVGMAMTWVTTPQMPPWWKYITKGEDDARDRSGSD